MYVSPVHYHAAFCHFLPNLPLGRPGVRLGRPAERQPRRPRHLLSQRRPPHLGQGRRELPRGRQGGGVGREGEQKRLQGQEQVRGGAMLGFL